MNVTINPKYKQLTSQIMQVPEMFERVGTLLYSGRNVVKLMNVAGHEVVVKRYKAPILLQRIVYTFFRASKAERAYRFGFEIARRGFDTPEPIAYIENKRGGLLYDSYFISAKSDGEPLYDILVRPMEFPVDIAHDVGRLMAKVNCRGLMHGDPNLNNILLKVSPDGQRSYVMIDTNRSKFATGFSYKKICKNLMRLTHRRDLLPVILDGYAAELLDNGLKITGFTNSAKLKNDVLHQLEAFEKRKERRHLIKNKLKIS